VDRKDDRMFVYGFIWEFIAIMHIMVVVVFYLTIYSDFLRVIFVVVLIGRNPKDVLRHIKHASRFLHLFLAHSFGLIVFKFVSSVFQVPKPLLLRRNPFLLRELLVSMIRL
jgi:hypothetical protein